jgi:hypothetical protein
LEASAEAVAAWRSRPGGRGLAGAAWRRRRRRLKRSGGGGGRSTPQPPSPTPSQAAVEAALEAEAEAVAAWRSRPGGRGLAEAAAGALYNPPALPHHPLLKHCAPPLTPTHRPLLLQLLAAVL